MATATIPIVFLCHCVSIFYLFYHSLCVFCNNLGALKYQQTRGVIYSRFFFFFPLSLFAVLLNVFYSSCIFPWPSLIYNNLAHALPTSWTNLRISTNGDSMNTEHGAKTTRSESSGVVSNRHGQDTSAGQPTCLPRHSRCTCACLSVRDQFSILSLPEYFVSPASPPHLSYSRPQNTR